MILPDINLLLYAYNPHIPQHSKAAAWWRAAMLSDELIGIPNEVCLGFVRIATNHRLGSATVGLPEARAVVEQWLQLPQTRVLVPAPNHFVQVMDLMTQAMGSGALVSDASLATYALTHRATLCSNDTDFARFPQLSWINPLIEPSL